MDVANQIEQLQQNFLWSSLGDESKIHLVKWALICAPFQSSSLAIRNLRYFNEAFLGKWLWIFGTEREELWRRVTGIKYGCERGGWCSNPVEVH